MTEGVRIRNHWGSRVPGIYVDDCGYGVDPSWVTIENTQVVEACFSFRPLWWFSDGRCWSHSSRAMLPEVMVLVLCVLAPQLAQAISVALEAVAQRPHRRRNPRNKRIVPMLAPVELWTARTSRYSIRLKCRFWLWAVLAKCAQKISDLATCCREKPFREHPGPVLVRRGLVGEEPNVKAIVLLSRTAS